MKTTIVLLPGLNGTGGLFKRLIDCAPVEFNVIPVSYPTHEKQTYAQLAALVATRLESIDTPFILVGESFSGPLSLMLATRKYSNLQGIVLVSSFVTAPNLKVGRYLPWQLAFTLVKPLLAIRHVLSNSQSRIFIKSISTEMQKVAPSVLAHRIQSIFEVNVVDELKTCTIPVMYFRGTKDMVVPRRNLSLILKTNSNVSVVEFKTQHFLLQSKPDQAWQAIISFRKGIQENST